jgi:hypothetical protein
LNQEQIYNLHFKGYEHPIEWRRRGGGFLLLPGVYFSLRGKTDDWIKKIQESGQMEWIVKKNSS